MKERPILFSGPMVLAILEGRKTQTRRVVPLSISANMDTPRGKSDIDAGYPFVECKNGDFVSVKDISPYGRAGDRLWVREAWHTSEYMDDSPPSDTKYKGLPFWYSADGMCMFTGASDGGESFLTCGKKRPSIHMPRWASRITLEVTDIRVERLQEMQYMDAVAEGLKRLSKDGITYKYGIPDRDGLPGNDDYGWHWKEWKSNPGVAFKKLWDSINGKREGCSWDANPWVWVVEFERCQAKN